MEGKQFKLISHRGNVNGSNKNTENTVNQIEIVINSGFDCEIDLWYVEKKIYLGHDKPENEITVDFLLKHADKLWCHCKNNEMLEFLNTNIELHKKLHYFWHQNDDYTITSKGFVWVYPGKRLTAGSICVLPELSSEKTTFTNIYGICTDYVELYNI